MALSRPCATPSIPRPRSMPGWSRWAHPPPGRDADHARPGDSRLGGAVGCRLAGSGTPRESLAELAIGARPWDWSQHASGLRFACPQHLSELTHLEFRQATNLFAALSAHDALVAVSAALRGLAVAAMKIANDVRWLASPQRNRRDHHPENEPGSSIMPGKVTYPERSPHPWVCTRVFGNDAAVALRAEPEPSNSTSSSRSRRTVTRVRPPARRRVLTAVDEHCARGMANAGGSTTTWPPTSCS